MQVAGILPTHVILLDVPDEVLMDRALGRRLDPVCWSFSQNLYSFTDTSFSLQETGKIYHIRTNPPPPSIASRCIQRSDDMEDKVRTRLQQYYTNLQPLCDAYKSLLVRVKGNQAPDDVFAEVDKILSSRVTPSSLALTPHRVPRVVLIGAKNAGVQTQAALLQRRLGAVLLSVTGIIEAAQSTRSPIDVRPKTSSSSIPSGVPAADFAARAAEAEAAVEALTDAELLSILVRRLSQPDCLHNGYILTGFPFISARGTQHSTAYAIATLQNNTQVRPSHTLFLSSPVQELIARQTNRRFRKEDGAEFRLAGSSVCHRVVGPGEAEGEPMQEKDLLTRPDDQDVDAVRANVETTLHLAEGVLNTYNEVFTEVGESLFITPFCSY